MPPVSLTSDTNSSPASSSNLPQSPVFLASTALSLYFQTGHTTGSSGVGNSSPHVHPSSNAELDELEELELLDELDELEELYPTDELDELEEDEELYPTEELDELEEDEEL